MIVELQVVGAMVIGKDSSTGRSFRIGAWRIHGQLIVFSGCFIMELD